LTEYTKNGLESQQVTVLEHCDLMVLILPIMASQILSGMLGIDPNLSRM